MWARVVDRHETPETPIGTGPQGPAGPQGPQGETGPQGPAGADGTGGGGGPAILSDYGPPASGSGLEPLNGVNDPWRWMPPGRSTTAWYSPPVDVTWEVGATTTAFAAPAQGSWTLVVQTGQGIFEGDILVFSSNSGSVGALDPGSPVTLPDAGSGRAFLTWDLATEGTGSNADTLPAESRTVADALGTDFTVTPAEWPEGSVGTPGDYFYDAKAGDFYGPRGDDGSWPYLATFGMSPTSGSYIEAQWTFGEAPLMVGGMKMLTPGGSVYRLTIGDDGTLSTEPA